MPDKTKKIIKIIATITCFEAIVGFVVVIALIVGVMTIMSKTGYNLFLSIPACIIFVLVVMFAYWKIEKKVSNYFKTK
jgi:membrane-anchored protein YejM (alkaline phosphatase superfamily)